MIEKGKPHSVRAASGDEFAVALIEVRPAATFGILLRNYLGLDHEGKLSPEGVPEFLQAMVHTSTFYQDTVFTTPPPSITIPLAKALTPVARLAGHQGRNPRYEDDAFWLKRVAQPEVK
ncbi:MAG: hypothetical protein AAF702_45365 [Chloroflexota bacterium]